MCQHNLPCSIVLPTACFPEGPSPHFTLCSFWRRRPRLEAVIVGYTVGKVLRRRVSGAVKRDFRTYIRRYTSPNENFEYGYPHSNALLTLFLQKYSENALCCAYTSSGCQLHKTACQLHIFTCQPMKSDVTYLTSGFRQYIAGYTVANL